MGGADDGGTSDDRLRVAAATALLIAVHVALVFRLTPSDDERALVDQGRLLFSACTPATAVPWDQPPALPLLSGVIWALGRTFGVSPGVLVDLPIVAGRLLFAIATPLPWLLFRRRLPAGVARAGLFVVCLAGAPGLFWSQAALVHGLAGVALLVALWGLTAPKGRWVADLAAAGGLLVAVALSYAVWPAVPVLAIATARGADRRQLRFAPAVLLIVGWLLLATGQVEWLDRRLAGVPQGALLGGALDVVVLSTGGAGGPTMPAPAIWELVQAFTWIALAIAGTVPRAGDAPSVVRLRRPLAALCWTTWIVLVLLTPVAWLLRGKFLFFLHWPLAVLACLGLAAVASRLPRWGTHAAVVALFAVLLLGSVRQQRLLDSSPWPSGQHHRPLAWSCQQPWIPGPELADRVEGLLLPAPDEP